MGRSLVQRSHTGCGASSWTDPTCRGVIPSAMRLVVCALETLTMKRPGPDLGYCATERSEENLAHYARKVLEFYIFHPLFQELF